MKAIKPDVITVNPRSIDYPLWRATMESNLSLFNKIINGFYPDNRKDDYTKFITSVTPWATSIEVDDVLGDWREYTLKYCLLQSASEWVLFLEQDFVADASFWSTIFERAKEYDVVGFTDINNQGHESGQPHPKWTYGTRLHPAFLLVKRIYLENTSKDFGAYPEKKRDHFGIVTDELLSLSSLKFLDLYTIPGWKHYAGVYYDFMLVQKDEPPVGKDFKEFAELSLNAPTKQDERFMKWCRKCLL